jgi:hypothetical protein
MPAGQLFDGRAEIDIVGAHQKADRVAVRAAAETVKKSPVFDDVEGRCFFLVERAETGIFTPAPHQLDTVTPDQFGQHNAAAQFVEEFRRITHGALIEIAGAGLARRAIICRAALEYLGQDFAKRAPARICKIFYSRLV